MNIIRCTRCNEILTGELVWLERNWRTGTYHQVGTVPEEYSQGCFEFGKACAKRQAALDEQVAQ